MFSQIRISFYIFLDFNIMSISGEYFCPDRLPPNGKKR